MNAQPKRGISNVKPFCLESNSHLGFGEHSWCSGARRPVAAWNLLINPLEFHQCLANNLIHVVVPVSGETSHKPHVRGRGGESLVGFEQRLILRSRYRIVRITLRN